VGQRGVTIRQEETRQSVSKLCSMDAHPYFVSENISKALSNIYCNMYNNLMCHMCQIAAMLLKSIARQVNPKKVARYLESGTLRNVLAQNVAEK
jgi:hypothetical protein